MRQVKNKFPLNKIVLISWRDASSRSMWGSREEYLEHEPMEILTVGFLLKQDKKSITVVASQAEDSDLHQAIAIPRDWVTKIKVLASCKPKRKRA